MTQEWHSTKRRRTYRRKFDHDEARRRVAAGESIRSVAEAMGVTHHAVWRVVQQPNLTTAEPTFKPPWDTCPTCQGPKSKYAELCRQCRMDARLAPPQLRRHRMRYRVMLASVSPGSVVRYRDDFAVVEPAHLKDSHRWLHYWTGPPELVRADVKVDALAWTEVLA